MSLGLHHLHKRLSRSKRNTNGATRSFDYVMYVVGSLSFVALLPQVQTIFTTHSVAGLSLITWSVLCGINCLWVVYAFLHNAKPVIIANSGLAIINFVIVIGILMYR